MEELSHKQSNDNSDINRILGLIAINQVYLEFTDKLVAKVDRAIEKNRKLQENVKLCSAAKMDRTTRILVAHLPCFPPYFKDSNGMTSQINEEARRINEVISFDPLLLQERPWKLRELKVLYDAVRDSLIQSKIEPLISKKDLLVEKLRSAGVEIPMEQKQEWRLEIDSLNRRIIYFKQRPDSEIFALDAFNEVDWAKISVVDFDGSRTVMQLKSKWINEQNPKINKTPWTEEENKNLLELSKGSWRDWNIVAEELGTYRTPYMCFQQVVSLKSMDREKKPWTNAEDEKLLSLIQTLKVGNKIPWAKISSYIPGRTKTQCQARYNRSLNRTIKHGRWSIAEDMLLLNAINKYGPQDWDRISNIMQNRSSIQCRDRWINVLDYKRRKKPWLWEEHERLFFGIKIFGRRNYAKIALLLPGRNNVDVRQRIRALIRYKIWLEEQKEEPTTTKRRANGYYSNTGSSYLYFKERQEAVLEKFHQFVVNQGKVDESISKECKLAGRTGFGSFVINQDGSFVDYSESKIKQREDFGRIIAKSGRWSKILKNPNEFGNEELLTEMAKMDEEQCNLLRNFLKESDERYLYERELEQNCPVESEEAIMFYESMLTEERMERIDQFLSEHLPLLPEDLARHFHTRIHHPKITITKKERRAKDEENVPKKTRKRKTVMFLDRLPPKRSSVTHKYIDAVNKDILNLAEKDNRRSCTLRNLCNYISRCDARENTTNYRKGFRYTVFKPLEEYIRKVAEIPSKTKESVPSNSNNQKKSASNSIKAELIECPETEVLEISESDNVVYDSTPNPFDLKQVLESLLPPTMATINGVTLYKKKLRLELLKAASRIFNPLDENLQNRTEVKSITDNLDIRLSEEITKSPQYLQLKKIMYKLFFLPMLMQRGISSAEEVAEQKIQRERIIQRRRTEECVSSHLEHSGTSSAQASTSRSCQETRLFNPKLECFDECFEMMSPNHCSNSTVSTTTAIFPMYDCQFKVCRENDFVSNKLEKEFNYYQKNL